MNYRKKILSASIAAGLCFANSVYAQNADTSSAPTRTPDGAVAQDSNSAAANRAKAEELDTIVVTGIRESLKKSLDKKHDADAVIDAITAEDIGKFPATNVAEAMTVIPGVTVDRRFGQGERVSIDGTDPSLNLSFIDGHPLAQTTWLYGEQPNRGFDYTLLAPEILGQLEVFKSSEARLPEGSLGGTVFLHTRNPLDLPSGSISGSIGATYGDQSDVTKPNASFLYSWKDTDQTFGIAVSAQHYEEKVAREGSEIFAYVPVSALTASTAVKNELASGQLRATDLVPDVGTNAAFFQQTRKRNSGTLNVQWKPSDVLEFDLKGLFIKEKFDNFNQSMYPFLIQNAANITSLGPVKNGVVTGGTVCGNDTVGGCSGPENTYLDDNVRTSTVTTKGLDLSGRFKGDGFTLFGQVGVSKADDDHNAQYFIEPYYQGGYSWNIAHGATYTSPAAAANPANWHDGDTPDGGWGGNDAQNPAHAKDTYAQLDFTTNFDGFFNEFLAGVRYAKHTEDRELNIYGGVRTGNIATIGFNGLSDILGNYPGGFSSDQSHHVTSTAGQIIAWINGSPINFANPDPGSFLNNTYSVEQESKAAYAQVNFGVDKLRGNFGLRFVDTDITSSGYNYSGTPVLPAPAGSYQTADTSHNNVLPAFNIAYDFAEDVVLRGAASEVIAWAPYNQEVHNTFLNDTTLTGSGGNSNLDPYRAVNFNVSAEWYFAPQSVLAFSVFYKDILNYITTDSHIERQYNSLQRTGPDSFNQIYVGKLGNCTADGFCDYNILRPLDGGRATAKGFTVSYQQPFGDSGFGLQSNYTYSDASTKSGQGLPYNSKNAVSLSPYFEKGPFSARVTYGWRSAYLAGGYVAGAPPASVNDYSELDASVGWKFNDHLSLNLDAQNLLDETYFEYLGEKDLLAAKYKEGRRYMATLRFKF